MSLMTNNRAFWAKDAKCVPLLIDLSVQGVECMQSTLDIRMGATNWVWNNVGLGALAVDHADQLCDQLTGLRILLGFSDFKGKALHFP